MEYSLYKLEFHSKVHFGRSSLETSDFFFHADTLFSALFLEALQSQEAEAEALLTAAREGDLLISDAFPYIGELLYLPRPCEIYETGKKQSSREALEYLLKRSYIPLSLLDRYLSGTYPLEDEGMGLSKLGCFGTETQHPHRGGENRVYVRTFTFREGNGLYFLLGCGNEDISMRLMDLLEGLCYAGIGGRRSTLGNFSLKVVSLPPKLRDHLESPKLDGRPRMLLSAALPREEELSGALRDASYRLIRRGAFPVWENRKSHQRRDLYVFDAGSVFRTPFAGDVYDIAPGAPHPVYRFEVPLFLTLD